MTLWKWSQTPASNATADNTINWAEGMAPSAVNDSSRAMMAAVAKYRDDNAGSIVTGGGSTSTAYVLTSNQGFDTLAHLHNQSIAFVPSVTSTNTAPPGTPVSVTLNVDSTGAKPIRLLPGLEISSGTLIQGTPYLCTYNNTDGAFYIQNFGSNPYAIPLGGMMPFTGLTPPNSAFALPFGQAISRAVFSALFNLYNSMLLPYGIGDGSLTFNLPDLRGRTVFGLDNMGGSTAGRITSAGSGITGTVIGTTGGQESAAIARSALPNIALAITLNDSVTSLPPQLSGVIGSNGIGNLFLSAASGSSATTHTITASQPSLNGNVTQTGVPIMGPLIIVPWIIRVY